MGTRPPPVGLTGRPLPRGVPEDAVTVPSLLWPGPTVSVPDGPHESGIVSPSCRPQTHAAGLTAVGPVLCFVFLREEVVTHVLEDLGFSEVCCEYIRGVSDYPSPSRPFGPFEPQKRPMWGSSQRKTYVNNYSEPVTYKSDWCEMFTWGTGPVNLLGNPLTLLIR